MDSNDNNRGASGNTGEVILTGFSEPIKNGGTTPPTTPPSTPPGAPPTTPPVTPPANDLTPFTVDDTDKFTAEFLITTYGGLEGVRLNANGDLVNVEGKILVPKNDLLTKVGDIKQTHSAKAEEYIKGVGEVEIEGKTYKIAEDGSVKDGDRVLLTKEELINQVLESGDYLSTADPDGSIYELANTITGFDFTDDKGNVIEFEESPEGLAKRDLYIAHTEGQRIAQNVINDFFATNAELEDAFYYLKTKGTLQGYGTMTNHEGISIDENDVTQQTNLVVEAEMARGSSRERAIMLADMFKGKDKLFEEAKSSLAYLVKAEKDQKNAIKKNFEDSQAALAKEQKEYWTNVTNIVQRGKLLDYNIPENIRIPDENGVVRYATKSDFLEYLSKPVKDGLTAAQLDAKNEPIELQLFYNFLRFINNDISYVINQRAKSTKVEEFKSRFNTNNKITRKVTIQKSSATRGGRNDNVLL